MSTVLHLGIHWEIYDFNPLESLQIKFEIISRKFWFKLVKAFQ